MYIHFMHTFTCMQTLNLHTFFLFHLQIINTLNCPTFLQIISAGICFPSRLLRGFISLFLSERFQCIKINITKTNFNSTQYFLLIWEKGTHPFFLHLSYSEISILFIISYFWITYNSDQNKFKKKKNSFSNEPS